MITEKGFWRDRDKVYASELTPEIRANAAVTIERANKLLALFYAANPQARVRDASSGWRPAGINAKVGGAKLSNHMLGKAVDIADSNGFLDQWLMTPAGQKALEECELWLEHPSATPTWCHVQTVPPRSGRRVFHP